MHKSIAEKEDFFIACSPDVNTIKRVWGHMKFTIREMINPKVQKFKLIVVDEW